MEIFYFLLPILLLMFVCSLYRVIYLLLPLTSLFLHSESPQTQTAQIILLVLWGLLLLTTCRMRGFGQKDKYPFKTLYCVIFAAFSVVVFVLLVERWQLKINGDLLTKALVYLFFSAIIYFFAVVPIARFIVAPLFCRRKTVHQANLEDYVQLGNGHRNKLPRHYIRFEGDPIQYEIDLLSYYRKYRNKVGVPFSYERCECPFGVVYIRNLKMLSEMPGKASPSDSLRSQEQEKKSIRQVVKIFGIIMACLVAVFLVLYALLYSLQGN